jgi:isopentenyl-diphosphate delta-isomerase
VAPAGRDGDTGTTAIVLVDSDDRPVGTTDKFSAHRSGALHRAFSVFVFDARGRILLQRRARTKYHSGGKWANSCCGHPTAGEPTVAAAERRLWEEMGIRSRLAEVGTFVYRAELDDGLIEHELDHVLVGHHAGTPHPDPREVEAWRWAPPPDIHKSLQDTPEEFAVWFERALAIALRGA